MQVNNYNMPVYRAAAPAFGASMRTVRQGEKLVNGVITEFFRDCFNWIEGTAFLVSKYKNADRVNVINYASSDGSEAYSLAMRLLKAHDKEAEKFFPIICRDIDKTFVERGKNGLIDIDKQAKNTIISYLGDESLFNKYFVQIDGTNTYKVQDKLRRCVKFEEADMVKDSLNLPSSNTVVMARNVWPYLSSNQRWSLVYNLEKLNKSSTVITGQFDDIAPGSEKYINLPYSIGSTTSDKLIGKGFERLERGLGYVYEKKQPALDVYVEHLSPGFDCFSA